MGTEALVRVVEVRHELGMSQAQLADLVGVSARAVQSWEQGWRKPSAALEKALLLLLMAARQGARFGSRVCWDICNCPSETREKCFAYRTGQGHLCWFLTGNHCQGRRLRTWSDKRSICTECPVFCSLLTPTSCDGEQRQDG